METVSPNPNYTMGHVIHYWDSIINPGLKSRETEGLAEIILDCRMRGSSVMGRTSALQWKGTSWAEFNTVMIMLSAMYDELRESPPDPRILEYLRLTASRYLSQMDMIMRDDEDYEAAKRGE